ncbi:nucleoside/nucleotide kinase family protein [Amycolatopsis antarctica]|uniref:Nucleoside/nucleotide kinase family protein n=1 Tax=Amycolatopsis antarctica TaxID=1854586 RepID=A0A263D7Y0_9PSEU|nr:nucleoside/nucleotide kinase family protein [Amycolatopsis antarctica]OZM73505.1 nucleoside/nucleotide kinase family protein [Amycolatopsis antarctica]
MTSFGLLLERARGLAAGPGRGILGIAGQPASGKSTLACALAERLGTDAVVVGMDGFHLAHAELRRLGRAERKGAPDTFDAEGYVELLRRIRSGREIVYAPEFRREIEEPVAGAVPVGPDVPLVITEGNYLLLPDGPWAGVRPLLDETWFLAPPEPVRLDRLVTRHRHYGRSDAEARYRAFGPDQHNAELIAATEPRADLTINL